MAQTVFEMDSVDFHSYANFGTRETGKFMMQDIKTYIENYDFNSNEFFTFIAGFDENTKYSEKEFEALLWQQLQHLHDLDNEPWDPDVSNNADSEEFSFSLFKRAFYIVGLHPNSSRMARQSPFPAIVFNLHWQFEKLREMGSYQVVRDRIRQRDEELQGTINPMMEDFGKGSEAKQYSGRKVGKEWKCPFHK
jgi:FPC/CPF motif-containing protein YcgG